MERDGRTRYNTDLQCVFTRVDKVERYRGHYKMMTMSNGKRYLVDTNLVSEAELNTIVNRCCYFQVGVIKGISYVFDIVRM